MAAGKYSFVIEQGSTFDTEIQYRDVSGNPIDLTGYHARMQIRPTVDSEIVFLTLSSSLQPDNTGLNMSGSSGTVSPVSGSIGINISAATSSLLNFTEAVYDLEIMKENTVSRLLEGKVKLSKEVTR
jgi:hypothetical protein